MLSSIWRIFQMAWILATEIFVVSIKKYTFAIVVNFICWHYNFGQTIQQFFLKSQLVYSQSKFWFIMSPDLKSFFISMKSTIMSFYWILHADITILARKFSNSSSSLNLFLHKQSVSLSCHLIFHGEYSPDWQPDMLEALLPSAIMP